MGLLTPDLFVESVCDLDPDRVKSLGLDALLLDVDCTLKRYRATEVADDVRRWIDALRGAGIKLCLVSNGKPGRIGAFARQLELPFVGLACKPLPRGCRQALDLLGVPAARAAMVGDQMFADLLAGKLSGLYCILVRPIHPEDEPWFTQFKRPFERWILGQR